MQPTNILNAFIEPVFIFFSSHRLTGGELFDYCTSKDYLIEGEAIFFMKQMLSALEYLHAKKICHLDLKVHTIKNQYVYVYYMYPLLVWMCLSK